MRTLTQGRELHSDSHPVYIYIYIYINTINSNQQFHSEKSYKSMIKAYEWYMVK